MISTSAVYDINKYSSFEANNAQQPDMSFINTFNFYIS